VTVIIGSILMVGVSISGFKGIDKLALVLVPAMAGFMIYAASLSYGRIQSWDIPTGVSEPLTFPLAVSAVIGSYIAGVIIQPDYSRFARNIQHAMWAVFIALGLSFPVVQFLAAVPSVATGKQDLMAIMLSLGIGVPAFLLLLLGSWSSNVLNLYSSSLSLATIFTRVHLWQLTVAVGVIGTALAFLHVQDYLVNYLILLGIAIPPIGSIYIVDVLFVRRGHCDDSALEREPGVDIRAFIAWLMATAVGYFSSENIFTILGIASMDTILVASIVYGALKAPQIYEQWAAAKP
jgi:cytosine permease